VEEEESRVRQIEYARLVIRKATTRGFIMTETYKWHEVYKAAVLETDWTKMEERIQAAEAALHERKNEFALNHGGTPEENQAIEDALRGLGILRDDAARWREKRAS
jgi:uncharacterized protein YecA (UPF0149 family)